MLYHYLWFKKYNFYPNMKYFLFTLISFYQTHAQELLLSLEKKISVEVSMKGKIN